MLVRISGISALAVGTALGLIALTWPAAAQAQTSAAIEQGLKIIASREQGNCVTCHTLSALRATPGIEAGQGAQGDFGPSLDGVGTRYSVAQLRQWVTDARQLKPDALMPPFGSIEGLTRPKLQRTLLTPEQIDQVVAALAALR